MKFLSFKDYLIISRPIIFPLILLCLVVALFYSVNNISQISIEHIIFIFLLTFFLPFFTFSVNDLEDFESDRINDRKKGIIFGKFLPNLKIYSQSIHLYIFVISLILILYSLLFFNQQVVSFLFLLLFFLYFYSAKPFRFKEKLFLDFISNGLIALLTFFVIFVIFNDFKQLSIDVYAVSISIMSYHLIAAQIDLSSDKKVNHKTTATIINNKEIVYLMCILLNLPLLFVILKGNFKFLFFINILIILQLYFFPKIKKTRLFFFFFIGWLFITITYIFSFI